MRTSSAPNKLEIRWDGVDTGSMTMAQLMREIASLPAAQKDELAAYLLHLRLSQDPAWRAEMTRRIDDSDPARWVSLADWKRELADNSNK